ncbi:MAG: hemerythrin domain-containing protein [Gallionella sp.]
MTHKKEIVAQICTELSVHAQIEEEIFYPAVKQALKDKKLVPEATVEHATLKGLIAQVEDAEPDNEMFDAKMKVMSEYVQHHVQEEQNEMFPKAKASKMDMMELGMKLTDRKAELMAEHDSHSEDMKQQHLKSASVRATADSGFAQKGIRQEHRLLKHRRTADQTL